MLRHINVSSAGPVLTLTAPADLRGDAHTSHPKNRPGPVEGTGSSVTDVSRWVWTLGRQMTSWRLTWGAALQTDHVGRHCRVWDSGPWLGEPVQALCCRFLWENWTSHTLAPGA